MELFRHKIFRKKTYNEEQVTSYLSKFKSAEHVVENYRTGI